MYLSRFVRLIRCLIYTSILIVLWEQLIIQAFIRLLRVRDLSPPSRFLPTAIWFYFFPFIASFIFRNLFDLFEQDKRIISFDLCKVFSFLPTKVEKLCDIFRFSLTISFQRLSLFCSRDKGSAWVHSNWKNGLCSAFSNCHRFLPQSCLSAKSSIVCR